MFLVTEKIKKNQIILFLMKNTTSSTHPAIINIPPIGVIGPKNFKFTFQYSEKARK